MPLANQKPSARGHVRIHIPRKACRRLHLAEQLINLARPGRPLGEQAIQHGDRCLDVIQLAVELPDQLQFPRTHPGQQLSLADREA